MNPWKRNFMLLTASVTLSLGMGITGMAEEEITYETASEETPIDADFSCVISEDGEVSWKMNMTNFEKLAKELPEGSRYVRVTGQLSCGDRI